MCWATNRGFKSHLLRQAGFAERRLNSDGFAADDSNVDPISGRSADQASPRSFGRARPGGTLRSDLRAARASHRGAALVASGVFALAVLALVGLWTRSGAGVGVDSSNILPSTLIAVLAVAAVASTYRLGHRARPALVRNNEHGSSAATVTSLARANAAHMAGVSHIRILERDAILEARVSTGHGSHGSAGARSAS